MDENKLIKKQNSALQKIGNAIAISNQLIAENFYEQGNLLHKKWKFEEASVLYLSAIKLRPNYIEALNYYALCLKLIKNYQEAILYFSKVIDLNPQYEYALSRRGDCKGSLGDYLGQIEDYSKIIEFDSDSDLHLYISRAIVRKKINDHQGIIEDCTFVISKDVENSTAFGYRGQAKIALSDFNGAILDLEKAIEIEESRLKLDPNYKPILFGPLKNYGIAKQSMNDFQGALEAYNKLADFFPQNPQAYKLRADANIKTGNIEAYKKDLAIFQKLNDEHYEKYGVHF